MIDIVMRVKQVWFNQDRVLNTVNRARIKVLSRSGAKVMTSARQSIRKAPFVARKARGQKRTDKRTKTSEPGRPPFGQVGTLKRSIFFSYDPLNDSVVIGPIRLNQRNVPHLLEFGGTTTIVEERDGKRVQRVARYKPRPFMGPALVKEAPTMPRRWANSVQG